MYVNLYPLKAEKKTVFPSQWFDDQKVRILAYLCLMSGMFTQLAAATAANGT